MSRVSVLGVVVALLGTAAIVWLSQAPYQANPGGEAVLRLSWRYQPATASDCRRPTDEELAALPAHMRNPDACASTPTPYSLTLAIDGEVVGEEALQAAGARQDRPVFVFLEFPLGPGDHELEVIFASHPEDTDAATPITLSWAERLTVQPRDIVLIGYDRDTGALVRVGSGNR